MDGIMKGIEMTFCTKGLAFLVGGNDRTSVGYVDRARLVSSKLSAVYIQPRSAVIQLQEARYSIHLFRLLHPVSIISSADILMQGHFTAETGKHVSHLPT